MPVSKLIMLVVAVDLLITVPFVIWLMRRRAMQALDAAGIDLRKLRAFTDEVERTTEEHMRVNWSGDPTTLPLVLTSLLATLENRAREESYPIERELLKRLMAQVITSRRLANAGEVREALKQVA